MANKYSIAVIGRTNVGKSTLFNKLTEQNLALTSPAPNTTRDRNYGQILWRGAEVTLVDTGGLDAFDFLDQPATSESIEQQIIEQTNKSLSEADLLFFVIDGRVGILPQEKTLAKALKKINKPVIIVCNKIDNTKLETAVDLNELEKLNLGQPICVSAKSGRNTGDLLDRAYDLLPTVKKRISKKAKLAAQLKPIKIALIGKPNVGKSSLLNSLLDEKHAIVSPIAHTTREPQDVAFTYKQQPFVIVDTVGIRKKAKIERGIESFGIDKTLDSLKKADIAILVIDASSPLSGQDNYLANEIRESGRGVIIVANKWDLIKDKQTNTINEHTEIFYNSFPYLWWVPIIFISALTKMRVKNILELSLKINAENNRWLEDKELEVFLKKLIQRFKPTKAQGMAKPRVQSLTQESTNPPTFSFKLYPGADLDPAYLRYVENQLRKDFGFSGAPIRIHIVKAKKIHSVPGYKPISKRGVGVRRKIRRPGLR